MGTEALGRGRWRGRLLALAAGVLLVAGIEALLHLVPGFRPPPLVITLAEEEGSGRALRQLNPIYPRRFFAGSMGGFDLGGVRLAPHRFVDPPPDSALRVVVVGASTVQGYPHPSRLAAPAFLGSLLAGALDRPVQVLNLGITSLASFAVARVVEDALGSLDPDLVVVYTGHNEFYGVYGAASLRQGGPGPWSRHLHYRLTGLRLAGLARWLTGWVRQRPAQDLNLLAAMGSAGPVPPGHPARERALRQLRSSLEEIAAACRRAGSGLVLCAPAANDAGFLPDTTSAAGRGAAEVVARARALEAEARLEEARRAYLRARGADPAPWRAPPDLVAAVRESAVIHRVPLADAERRLAEASAGAAPGWDLMVDHVHPTARGHALLARSVVDALVGAPPPWGVPADWESRAPGDAALLEAHGLLPVEAFALAEAAAGLLSRPPVRQAGRAAWLRRQAGELREGLGPEERRGYQAWRKAGRRPPLVLPVADELFAARRFARAARHYRAAGREAPLTAWGDLWPALRLGRCRLYLQDGRLTPSQRAEVEEAVRRAGLVALAPGVDPRFRRTFDDYARRLLAAPPAEEP